MVKDHGFRILKSFNGKPHAGHYDIKVEKGKDRWNIEVKTGEKPQINILSLDDYPDIPLKASMNEVRSVPSHSRFLFGYAPSQKTFEVDRK